MRDARQDEELSTQRRARLLNLPYTDTSQIANKVIYKDLLSVPELMQLKLTPIFYDNNNLQIGITNSTSQQTMTDIKHRFPDQQVVFSLISDTGFRDYMKLYVTSRSCLPRY